MGDFRKVRNGLIQFQDARKRRDSAAALRAAGQIFNGCAEAASMPITTTADAGQLRERDRRECIGIVSELEATAAIPAGGAGAAGPPWDGTLLRIVLEFLKLFLIKP